jgi:hypothetical protein
MALWDESAHSVISRDVSNELKSNSAFVYSECLALVSRMFAIVTPNTPPKVGAKPNDEDDAAN